MSDIPATGFDVRAELARIDRDLAESSKLRNESEKFIAEQRKLLAEEAKLQAEGRKLDRDHWFMPWLVGFSAVTTGIAAGSLLLKAVGVLP